MINGLRGGEIKSWFRDSTLILSATASAIEEFYKKNEKVVTLDRARKVCFWTRD